MMIQRWWWWCPPKRVALLHISVFYPSFLRKFSLISPRRHYTQRTFYRQESLHNLLARYLLLPCISTLPGREMAKENITEHLKSFLATFSLVARLTNTAASAEADRRPDSFPTTYCHALSSSWLEQHDIHHVCRVQIYVTRAFDSTILRVYTFWFDFSCLFCVRAK